MKKFLLLTICSLLTGTTCFAQTNYNHTIVWGRLVLTDTINKRLRWEVLVQHRRQSGLDQQNPVQSPQITAYWPWLHYTLSPTTKISLTPISYFENWTLIGTAKDEAKVGTREIRLAARIDQEQKLGKFTLLNRYGVERRWRDLANNNVFQPNWRVRYMVRLERPIRASWLKVPLSVVVSDEVMVQFGYAVKGTPNIFDQNRLYGGVNVGLSRNIKASLGYIYWIQERSSGTEFDYSNVLWGVLTFDNVFSQFRKKR